MAEVNYGSMRLRASVVTSASTPNASASGGFGESILIESPDKLTGSIGMFAVSVTASGSIDGFADPGGSSRADWELSLRVDGVERTRRRGSCSSDGGTCTPSPFEDSPGEFTFLPISFVFGVPFPVGLEAFLFTSAQLGGSASAVFENSFEWDGMVVYDATGNVLSNVTVSSESGFDYIHGVPEPSSVALLGLSLGAMLALSRSGRFFGERGSVFHGSTP